MVVSTFVNQFYSYCCKAAADHSFVHSSYCINTSFCSISGITLKILCFKLRLLILSMIPVRYMLRSGWISAAFLLFHPAAPTHFSPYQYKYPMYFLSASGCLWESSLLKWKSASECLSLIIFCIFPRTICLWELSIPIRTTLLSLYLSISCSIRSCVCTISLAYS